MAYSLTSDATGSTVRRDAGFTLVEVLISVVLTGTIVLAIVGGMFAVVRTSQQNAIATKMQAVVLGAADEIAFADYCSHPEAVGSDPYETVARNAASTVGWDGATTVTVIDYDYWNPAGPADPAVGSWANASQIPGSDCVLPDSLAGDARHLQRITVRITPPTGSSSSVIQVIKSNIKQTETVSVTP